MTYLGQAAETALRRSAYQEAIEHLNKGLAQLPAIPDLPERNQQELALQIMLGAALTATKGYAAPEVEHAYARARELCQQNGESPQLSIILNGLSRFYVVRGEYQTAHEQAGELIKFASDQGLLLWLAWAMSTRGRELVRQGVREEGITQIQQGLTDHRAIGSHIGRPYQPAHLQKHMANMGSLKKD